MRACEGCRRRKIKCDAATTNAWPCAACVRLKLSCVPPTVNYDRTHSAAGHGSGLERVLDFDNSSHSGDEEYHPQASASAPAAFEPNGPGGPIQPQSGYGDGLNVFPNPPYSERTLSHPDFSYGVMPVFLGSFPGAQPFGTPSGVLLGLGDGIPAWGTEPYSAVDLSSVLGELKIEEDGVGMCRDGGGAGTFVTASD